jgi:hypothetical protein
MTRDEVEGRSDTERTHRGDARRAIIGRGLAERARERAALIVPDRGTIQPIDSMQWR